MGRGTNAQIAAIRDGEIQGPISLRGERLLGVDLSGAQLCGADLREANLAGSNLSGANLMGANLAGAVLTETDLTDADFSMAELTGAQLEWAKAQRAGFTGANLTDATLMGGDFRDATFTSATLHGADLARSDLTRVRLREAALQRAHLNGAVLREAEMSEADVSGANLVEADLRGAKLAGVTGFEKADWIGADLRDINFAGAYLLHRFVIDQNYLHEFRTRSRINAWVHRLWWLTSDCGRSITRWSLVVLLQVFLFAALFTLVSIDYGDYETWLSPVYYSVVTLTTLGYGDALPASVAAQLVCMAEVVIGYVMLGGLLSIFSNKMARRAQ